MSIQVDLYNNGFRIKGHAKPSTCSQISLMAWYVANTISYYYNKKSTYYTSHLDNKENINEGLTYLIIDTKCETSVEQLEIFKINIKQWVDAMLEDVYIFQHKDDIELQKGWGGE